MSTVITRTMRDGVKLAGTAFGPADGPPVLLFHGGGQTRHAWGRAGEVLGKAGYHAMSFDFRGHGDSDWAPDYATEDFVNDVHELATRQIEPPIIVGASLGGISGMLANAGEQGEISRALVMVDVAPRLNPAGVERIHGFMSRHTDGFESLEEAARAVAEYQPHRKQRSDPGGLRKNLRKHADGRWYWHWDPALLKTFRHGRKARLDSDLLYAAAGKLSQPVLLIRGMISDVIDDDIIGEFRQRIPHAEVAEVSGAGHMVAGDRNDIFLEAVMAFIRQLPDGRAPNRAQAI